MKNNNNNEKAKKESRYFEAILGLNRERGIRRLSVNRKAAFMAFQKAGAARNNVKDPFNLAENCCRLCNDFSHEGKKRAKRASRGVSITERGWGATVWRGCHPNAPFTLFWNEMCPFRPRVKTMEFRL
ncbi:hypothetical protein CDAR_535991 [Caerostris darwini]|uniref:Uncharacterized protein n=1 Tax=Caerostris darwini TaxID=1538125 RepID=A0AAV4QSW7_9ARAC|nr:hypothetical protein CDAR_535991 [Caerostris darwini]